MNGDDDDNDVYDDDIFSSTSNCSKDVDQSKICTIIIITKK